MKNLINFSLTVLVGALLTGASLPAYGVGNDKSMSYKKDAEKYLKKGDVKAAIIQLKNAVLAEPKNAQNRVALADIYLRIKDGLSAEKQYLRAIKLGIKPTKIILNLSKSRLLQRQYQPVLDTLHEQDVSADNKAEYYLIIGNAYQGLKNLDKALIFFKKGEQAGGKNDGLGIAIAQIYYFQKKMDLAEKKTDEVLVRTPENVRGLVLKGELVNLKSGPKKAMSYFEQALQHDPKNIPALFKMSAILFDLNRSDDALEKLDVIFSLVPNYPLANYLSAVIYAKKNQLEKAETFLDASGGALDNFPGALILRGIINYTKNNYAQAIYNLDKLIKITPENIIARRLLGAALLHQNNAEQAISVLMPAVKEGKAGPVIYALLGSANMKLGNFEKGTGFFQKAVKMKPGASKLRTQLALSKLAAGDPKAAQANLQQILDKDPNSKQAATYITLIALQEKNFKAAIVGAETLIKQSAKNPVGYNLKGVALMAQGNRKAARVQFKKALTASPSYHSASMNLARLALREGHEDRALEIYRNILKQDKKYIGALLSLARYYTKEKDFTSAGKYYQRAIESVPGNIRARVEFSEFFILQKKLERANAVAQQIIQDFPDRAVGYEASGNINLMERDAAAAVGNFERMAAILGDNAGAYQTLGRAQLRNNSADAARRSFLKALSLAKNKMPVIIDLAGLEAGKKNYTKALKYIDQLKKIDSKNPVAYILQGRLLERQGRQAKSLASYLKAKKLGAKGSRFTVDLARAYIQNKQMDKAVDVMKLWLAKTPTDLAVRHLLASYYLKVVDYGKSIEQYETILAMSAKNPVALNNIAWLYSKTGQKKKALIAAKQSYDLFPNEASFIDTYAWILVQHGDNKKGLELLQKAISKAPKMMEIRYHLAVALNNSGRKAAARQELETVVASGNNFTSLKDAKVLLGKLSR